MRQTRRSRHAAALASALFLMVACNSATDANPTPLAIMFESYRANAGGLYLMSADGHRVVSLLKLGSGSRTGDWSPDGRRIAFTTVNQFEIWLANADGSGAVQLTQSNGRSSEAQWSPDGTTISYLSDEDPTIGVIKTVSINGSGTRALPNTLGAYYSHDWSPDGRSIVFSKTEAVPIPGTSSYTVFKSLYVADISGSGLVRLTSNTSCGDVHPAWSPDGTKIAFASCHTGTKVAISVIGADGSNLTTLSDGVSNDYRPTWSPDGRKIAFQSDRAGNLDVWLMDADGANAVNLTADNQGFDTAPKWNSVLVAQ